MLPPEIWIKIAMCNPQSPCSSLYGEHNERDEHTFNALVRAVPSLGRWTIAGHNGNIVGRRLDLMIMFGYSVECRGRGHMREDYMLWYKDGLLHRNDRPAIVGTESYTWYYRGVKHRRDGPAFMSPRWFIWIRHGVQHRDDGPSDMFDKLSIDWCDNGTTHRDIMPAIIHENGSMKWYRDGLMIDRR